MGNPSGDGSQTGILPQKLESGRINIEEAQRMRFDFHDCD